MSMSRPIASGSFYRSIARLLPFATSLLIVHAIIGCAGESRTQWLGIDIQFSSLPSGSQPASAPVMPADRKVDFQLMNELGASRLRIDIMNWSRIQPTENSSYDFSSTDQIVRLAQQNNIEIIAVCCHVPAWASADSATGLPSQDKSQAFTAFVRAFVTRYSGDRARRPIQSYECFVQAKNTSTTDYAYWLKLFHDTVKSISPQSTVILGSLTSPGLLIPSQPEGDYNTFFERLLADPALQGPHYPYFDIVGFYNYPRSYPGRPPFEHAVAYLRQTMAARRFDRPLWLTAFGANSNDPHTTGEGRQAADLVRWAIHARTLGIERMYLHTLRDDPPLQDPKTALAYGLVKAVSVGGQPAPKPAFNAMITLMGILKTQGNVTRRADGIYMLSGEKEPTYVLWKVASYDPSSFLIPGWWVVQTLNGQRFVRQGAKIAVTEKPIFLQKTTSPFIR